MFQLLTKYLPVLKPSKPIEKCVRVLDESGLSALQGCFDCTDWSVFVQSCENVDQLNDCVTDYINFCVDIQTREKEVVCCPINKPLITKDLKKMINEKKFLFAQGIRMALKLKQKDLRKEIIKCNEIYKKKIESHFKQGNMKETWSAESRKSRDIRSQSRLFHQAYDLDELNKFYATLDTIDFSTEVADEKMELNVSKNADECLVISENETRKEYLNVNANKAKGPDELTGKVLKTCESQLSHIYSHISSLSLSTSSFPNI